MLLDRGAPTQVAGHSVGNLVPPKGSASRLNSRRGQVQFLGRQWSSIKCRTHREAVSGFRPPVFPAPAGHLLRLRSRRAAHMSRVHCAAAPAVASSPRPPCSHCPAEWRASWQQLRSDESTGWATSQGESAVLDLRLQVAGFGVRRITNRCSGPRTHKVLGRGRGRAAANQMHRARVLTGQLAAAELSR